VAATLSGLFPDREKDTSSVGTSCAKTSRGFDDVGGGHSVDPATQRSRQCGSEHLPGERRRSRAGEQDAQIGQREQRLDEVADRLGALGDDRRHLRHGGCKAISVEVACAPRAAGCSSSPSGKRAPAVESAERAARHHGAPGGPFVQAAA
jgi:hypothetical protein